VDERPSAHVHGAPGTAPLCELPPIPVRVAEHVVPGLLAAVQDVVGAGRAGVRGREEFVDRVAFRRLGVR
jgi:hypothetical protein